MRQEVFFLGEGDEARFCVACRPQGAPLGAVLVVPPFAEELNKSRRMLALAARALAGRGWLTLRIDLAGTGDSAGDSGDASWAGWLDDLDRGWQWLRDSGVEPRCLLGLRAGALLASDWVARSGLTPELLLWQPVSNGDQHLTQFLRIKAASQMLTESDTRGVVAGLKAALAAGESVEVAGYSVSSALASAMAAAKLQLPADYAGRVRLVEVLPAGKEHHTPGFSALLARLSAGQADVAAEHVTGPGFWQSVEIEECPALLEATLRLLDGKPA